MIHVNLTNMYNTDSDLISMLNKFSLIVVAVVVSILGFSLVSINAEAKIPTSRSELYKKLNWSTFCENSYKANVGAGIPIANQGLKWIKINSLNWILQVQCDQAAYQGVYEFVDVIRNDSTIFTFKKVRFATKTKNPMGVIVDYTKNQLLGNPIVITTPKVTIKNLEKARGLGDCGVYEEFKRNFITGVYKASVVKVNDVCDGNTNISSWDSYL
jgi:hypothetical protein